jgi:hypothetical protein
MSPFDGLQYFKSVEFDSPDEPGSGKRMDREFMLKLEELRCLAGQPIIITSGFRTVAHNRDIKGKTNSAHLRGLAADIYTPDSGLRFCVLRAAVALGIQRIEVAPLHVHVDIDSTLPQRVCVFLARYK